MADLVIINRPLPPSASEIPRKAGLYRVVDVETGSFYVGGTLDLRRRLEYHQYRLSRGTHPNPSMQQAWSASPLRLAFSVTVVMDGASRSQLLAAEQLALDEAGAGTAPSCMNILAVAGSHLGRKRTGETIQRMRAAKLGKKASDEAKAKMRTAKIGRKLSLEHRAALSEARKGKPVARPLGIINPDLRKLSDDQVKELRRQRAAGSSWRELASVSGLDLSACRRAVLGITYKDVK